MRVVKTSIFVVESFDRESELHALAAADPVALHRARALRPARQLVEIVQQAIGIRGDLQEPLREDAALDEVLAAPAAPVDDLFVREHGLIVRAPVHRRLALVRETVLVEAEKEPLIPAIVFGLVRRDLARPVVARCPSA